MCKKTGGWTRKLFDLAKKPSATSSATSHDIIKAPTTSLSQDVKVLVEGPYGGPGHTMFCSFSGAMFVCGGSGITFALSAIRDLVNKDLEGESRSKTIDLVWTIPDPSTCLPVIPNHLKRINLSFYSTPPSTHPNLHLSPYYPHLCRYTHPRALHPGRFRHLHPHHHATLPGQPPPQPHY